MKVACATPDFFGSFSNRLSGIFIADSEKDLEGLDMLVLTGGADVHPSLYNESVCGGYGFNVRRDSREVYILETALKLNPDLKVFGVCRGLQLMNVFLGGNLVQDMGGVGISHKGVHPLAWVEEASPIPKLPFVNSLHHQCINSIGDASNARTLAREPITGTIEAISWGSNLLAVQFHPEWLLDDVSRSFFQSVCGWMEDKNG